MFNLMVQELGDTTVLHLEGRLVAGDLCSVLCNAVLRPSQTRTLVIDLGRVEHVDAGGLSILLTVREWAHSMAISFKLMNVTNRVQQILELTRLDFVFECCSVRELLWLLHCADFYGSMAGSSTESYGSTTSRTASSGNDVYADQTITEYAPAGRELVATADGCGCGAR